MEGERASQWVRADKGKALHMHACREGQGRWAGV